jgi:GNAT superfamily N-acetyltransferase
MTNYAIRLATLDDLPAARVLYREYVTHMTSGDGYYPRNIIASLDDWTRSVATELARVPATSFMLLAERARELLAFLLWEKRYRLLGEPHEIAYVHHLWVRPSEQGHGIGPALSEVYCEHALAQGLTECEASYYPGTTWVASHPYDIHSITGHMPIGRLLAHFDKRRARHALAAERANGHDVPVPIAATDEQPEPRPPDDGDA